MRRSGANKTGQRLASYAVIGLVTLAAPAMAQASRFCDDHSVKTVTALKELLGREVDESSRLQILAITKASRMQIVSMTEPALGNFVEGRVTVYLDKAGRIVSIDCK